MISQEKEKCIVGREEGGKEEIGKEYIEKTKGK